MNPRRSRPPAGLIVGFGIIIGITMILAVSTPRVEEFSPASGSVSVSSMSRISLRFNQPMNLLSVESRISIDPALRGKFYWDGQTLIFEPDEPWPASKTVHVVLAGGAQSANRLPMLGQRQWAFEVGLPNLVYLWPGEGKSDLFRIPLEPGSEAIQLTNSEAGISEYSISLDGSLLVYVADRSEGGRELHMLDLISKADRLLLSCDAQLPCSAPAISPDGAWLAFERAEYQMGAAGRLILGGTQVWLKAIVGEQEAYAVSPQDHDARSPEWSPTGWLIYYDDHLKALALLDIGEGRDPVPFNYIPTGLGLLGSWSPDGTRLVYPDIVFPDEGRPGLTGSEEAEPLYYSHIYLVDVTSGRTADISPGSDWMVEDASPSFSPDGRWLAFTRKFLDPERWTPGRQIWLMNNDRTDPHPLTDVPGVTFSSLTWSPGSERLAFMRKPLADFAQPAEIWWIDVSSGETSLVVEDGFLPGWLP